SLHLARRVARATPAPGDTHRRGRRIPRSLCVRRSRLAGRVRWDRALDPRVRGAAAGYQPSSYGYGVPAGGDVTGGAGWGPVASGAAGLVLYGYSAFAQGPGVLLSCL